MTAFALILSATIAQPGAAPSPDAPFTLAVESWVARYRRPGVRFVAILGPRATGAIEALAADRYRVRELGARVILEMPEGERLKALAWGESFPDEEVKARCRAMLAAQAVVIPKPCRHCGAMPADRPGVCPVWKKPGDQQCPECGKGVWKCQVCLKGP